MGAVRKRDPSEYVIGFVCNDKISPTFQPSVSPASASVTRSQGLNFATALKSLFGPGGMCERCRRSVTTRSLQFFAPRSARVVSSAASRAQDLRAAAGVADADDKIKLLFHLARQKTFRRPEMNRFSSYRRYWSSFDTPASANFARRRLRALAFRSSGER